MMYRPVEIAQCDLQFPKSMIPVGVGQDRLPPVLVITLARYSPSLIEMIIINVCRHRILTYFPSPRCPAGMAGEMRPLIDPNIVRFIEAADPPVGFLFMLPDINEIAGKSGRLTASTLLRIASRRSGRIRGIETAVVVLIGAVQTQFGAGIGRILAGEIVRATTSSGYSSVAATSVHEHNVWSNPLAAQMKTGTDNLHRIYQKVL